MDTLAQGEEASLSLDLNEPGQVAENAVTRFSVDYGDIAESYSVRTGVEDVEDELDVRYAASGQVSATQVGAPLMSCDLEDNGCGNAMGFAASSTNGQYNNNHWSMVALNEQDGDTRNSAATYLELPDGADVLYASLEWSANRGADDDFESDTAQARLKVPGNSTFDDLTAESTEFSTDGGGQRQYYQSRIDITDLVSEYGSGEWVLADIALSDGRHDPDPSYYGGFGITVIYSHADLPDSRVALFDGSQWVRTGSHTDFTFVTDERADVTVGWVTWEGDRAINGDHVDINDDNLVPQRWNPGGNWPHSAAPSNGESDNAADATAFGSKYANSLGVDAKHFRSMSVEAGTHVLTALTDVDQYLISSMTVTIRYDE
jgi:hypothetical protein